MKLIVRQNTLKEYRKTPIAIFTFSTMANKSPVSQLPFSGVLRQIAFGGNNNHIYWVAALNGFKQFNTIEQVFVLLKRGQSTTIVFDTLHWSIPYRNGSWQLNAASNLPFRLFGSFLELLCCGERKSVDDESEAHLKWYRFWCARAVS